MTIETAIKKNKIKVGSRLINPYSNDLMIVKAIKIGENCNLNNGVSCHYHDIEKQKELINAGYKSILISNTDAYLPFKPFKIDQLQLF